MRTGSTLELAAEGDVSPGLISVIMPSFNAEHTIASAVRSALSQTHSNLEVLVVDDGSTDGTVARVEEIDDERLKVLEMPRRGVSAARNAGIRESRGEYLAFLDADDLWLEGKLAAQLAALEQTPEASVAYGLLDSVDSDGRNRTPLTRQVESGDLSQMLPVWNVIGNGSNWLMRRSVLDTVSGFNESLTAAEDWEFSVRLARHFEFVCVPEVLGLYRQGEGTASSDLGRVERSFLEAWRGLREQDPELSASLRRESLAVHYHYLTCRALHDVDTWRDSAAGLLLLAKCVVSSLGHREVRQRLGVSRRFVWRCLARFARPSDRRTWTAREEIRQTGLVREARLLADPSVLPQLISEEQQFSEAIEELQLAGHHHRVPYLITEAIARVTFDPNLVQLVEEVFGKGVPWVMWGANIRTDIPNAANHWHTDVESTYWPCITVVVGLDGCDAGNATKYIPYSQNIHKHPPGDFLFSEAAKVLELAKVETPVCSRVDSFTGFGNGGFYAFNAEGWHCGDPATAEGRVMLFMHYQRADAPRVPHMKDWIEGTWLEQPAPYLSSFDRPTDGVPVLVPRPHPQVNPVVAPAPAPYSAARPGLRSRLVGLLGALRSG